MTNVYKGKTDKINDILSIVKLGSTLFLDLVVLNTCFERNHLSLYSGNSYFKFMGSIVAVLAVTILYFTWLFVLIKKLEGKRFAVASMIEHLFLFLLYALTVLISGAYESHYKTLFLFIIITSTIQLGMKFGLFLAGLSSLFLLGMDLVTAPVHLLSDYINQDIIISAVFIFTAWPLGYYVRLERGHIEALEGLVNIDDLTGVYNHRFFQQSITGAVKKASEDNQSLSLLLLDIDYFKHYNDLYGHQEGDKLLTQLAAIMSGSVRKNDIVARYGGDEFAIILPDTDEKDGVAVGERIRETIAETSFNGEENMPKAEITVSIGLSVYSSKVNTKDRLIKSADDALYRAKFFNKNRVEVYTAVLAELAEDIEEEHIDLISSLKTLTSTIDAKDRYTYGHTERVVIYCDLMAEELDLSDQDRKTLKFGAYLHDIGKIETPQEILLKKTPLTDEEWTRMKSHPVDGAKIIKMVPSLKKVQTLILHHHERYDGTGYPDGLKGEEIPYLARIITIADSFDAMTSSRPYHDRKSHEAAFQELKRCKGVQFDPELVDVFIRGVKKLHRFWD